MLVLNSPDEYAVATDEGDSRDEVIYRFGEFALDVRAGLLTQRGRPVALKPKAHALLEYLVRRANELVSKEALLQAIWPRGFVCDAVLKVCIREIREKLGDASDAPRYVMTVHRRGYRFIEPVTLAPKAAPQSTPVLAEATPAKFQSPVVKHADTTVTPDLVGRAEYLGFLSGKLRAALNGAVQICFISGEAGIGKSALASAFARMARTQFRLQTLTYTCRARLAPALAYEALLDLLGMLRAASPQHYETLLTRHAPSWAALTASKRPAEHSCNEGIQAAPLALPCFELRNFFQAMAEITPLLLTIEDVHAVDPMLRDLIFDLVRSEQDTKIMLILTERSAGHSAGQTALLAQLREELLSSCKCEFVDLPRLSPASVREYVTQQGSCNDVTDWSAALYAASEGNPWLMRTIWRYWSESGSVSIGETLDISFNSPTLSLPPSMHQLLDSRLQAIGTEAGRSVLEAASICHRQFSAVSVAKILNENVIDIETICEDLVKRHGLLRKVQNNYPRERRKASRYHFVFKAFQAVVAESLPLARREHYRSRVDIPVNPRMV